MAVGFGSTSGLILSFALCLSLSLSAWANAKGNAKQKPKGQHKGQKAPKDSAELCKSLLGNQPPAQDLGDVDETRRKIVETAASQIGKVSEVGGEPGKKKGWETLLQFYKTAYAKEDDARWPPKNLQDQIESSKMPSKESGKRVQPYSWCGIFALWSVKTATGNPKIKWAGGPSGLGKYIGGTKKNIAKMLPGDIVIFKDKDPANKLTHHAVVERVAADEGKVYTIDGNLSCQQIGRKARPLADVAYYFKSVP